MFPVLGEVGRLAILATLVLVSATRGSAQDSRLFPEWWIASSAPTWEAQARNLTEWERHNLVATARRNLGRACADFEGFRWILAEPDLFLGPPLADLEFYALMEEQHEGVQWVDVNLTSAYGLTRDEEYVFLWDAPWGLWPGSGVYVDFSVCRTVE